MSSVVSKTKCIQCGREATTDYDTGSRVIYTYCPLCGHQYKSWLLRDRKTDPQGGWFKLRKDGSAIERRKHKHGYGCLCLANMRGWLCFSCFNKPLTDKDIRKCEQVIDSPDVDKTKSYLSVWDEQTKTATAAIGEIPPSILEPFVERGEDDCPLCQHE